MIFILLFIDIHIIIDYNDISHCSPSIFRRITVRIDRRQMAECRRPTDSRTQTADRQTNQFINAFQLSWKVLNINKKNQYFVDYYCVCRDFCDPVGFKSL